MSSAKTSTTIPDENIIQNLLQTGSARRRGEEELFSRYSYFIKEGIHKYSLTQEDAFDAYSDTILSAIGKIAMGSFEGRASLKTYLYQIFHNKCVDLLRKKTTNRQRVHLSETISGKLLQLSDNARSIIQQLIDQADWQLLKEKMKLLEEKCRQLLTFWGENYSDREIAAQLQYKTADVVKTSRLRCLERLRKLYKNE